MSEKKECEFAEEVRENGGYTMNCFYFGCFHQINGTCKHVKGINKQTEAKEINNSRQPLTIEQEAFRSECEMLLKKYGG